MAAMAVTKLSQRHKNKASLLLNRGNHGGTRMQGVKMKGNFIYLLGLNLQPDV